MTSPRSMYAAVIAVVLLAASVGFRRQVVQKSSAPTTKAAVLDTAAMLTLCRHTDPSDWECPDTTMRTQLKATATDVQTVVVTVVDTKGRVRSVQFGPETDAIFLSRKALETFLVRHYRATNPARARAVEAYIQAHSAH